ncbi:MAG: YfhO family protein [Lachnospiraceae bacterium]|nr:YfhO family protein [Lachnospiraceae bacterium]
MLWYSIIDFLEQKKSRRFILASSFLLTFAVMFAVIIGRGIWPFGDRDFMRTDFYNQYLAFYVELRRKLLSGNGLDFSWNIGLGSDYRAIQAYYVASPLALVTLLFPEKALIEVMTVLILVKLSLSASSFSLYLMGHFSRYRLDVVFFSLFYSLSGFMAAYNWNIMWLDSVALFPLVLLGFEKLVTGRGFRLYVLSLSLCALTNYYITMLIGYFLILYFLVQMVLIHGWRNRIRAFWRFAVCSLVAALVSSVITVPGVMALTGTKFVGASRLDLPDNFKMYMNPLDVLCRHAVNVDIELKNDHWPNIYYGVPALFLMPLWFTDRRVSRRKKVCFAFLFALFVFSFSNNIMSYIWHGFNYPDSLPARQSFIYIALVVACSYEAWSHLRNASLVRVGISFALSIALMVLGYFFAKPKEDFEPNLAFLVTGLFILFYFFIYLTLKYGWRIRPVALCMLCAMIVAELFTNVWCTSVATTSRTKYMKAWRARDAVRAYVNDMDDSFWRLDQNDRTTKNDGALSGIRTASVFSSTANAGMEELYKALGLGNSKVYYSYDGSTPLTDALFSVKYLITADEESLSGEFREFITVVEGRRLYRNRTALSPGYMLPVDLESEWDTGAGDMIQVQNSFARALGTGEELFVPAEAPTRANRTTVNAGGEGGHFYAYLHGASSDMGSTITETVERKDGSTDTYSFSKADKGCLMDLGELKEGETAVLKSEKGSMDEASVRVFRMNDRVMKSIYAVLSDEQLEVTEIGPSSLAGTIDVNEDGLFVMSVPTEKDWTLYVDGEKRPVLPFKDALISTRLSEGRHEILIKYRAAGSVEGLILSAVGILMLGVLLMWNRRGMSRA